MTVKMKVFALVLLLQIASSCAKSGKKGRDESALLTKKLIGKSKPASPAIIAIEIVDPKGKKNSKRTIEQALGYGHQAPPSYQVYKYSQRDIPSYQGDYKFVNVKAQNYEVQKSIAYQLPSQNLGQYYQPGTTLFSTLDNQGHVGRLSSHIPHEPQVPVIILRVYPNQLTDPRGTLHANLPGNHPLAAAINSIDIQGLLSRYLQNILYQQQQQHQQQQQQYQYQYYQQPQEQRLLTYENFPRDTHTKVHFRTDKNAQGVDSKEVKTIRIHLPEHHSFSSVSVETPEMQYGYNHQNPGQEYQQEQNYYYEQQPEQSYVREQQEQSYVREQPEQNYGREQEQSYAREQQEQSYAREQQEQSYAREQQEQTYAREQQEQNYAREQQEQNYAREQPEQSYAKEQPEQNYAREQTAEQNSEAPSQEYYHQEQQTERYYYQRPVEYQKEEKQAEQAQTEAPYNYHAHSKRSKKPRYSSKAPSIRLKPVKA